MRKQFYIKFRPQIESGEYKVETRDGKPVRIICWDRENNNYPIIFLTSTRISGEDESCFSCTNWGRVNISGETQIDLFLITPEPELSEFEKELESFYNHHLQVCTYDNQGTVEDSLHDGASKLLALAKKEIEKDLPRWVKVNEGDLLDKYSKYLLYSNEGYYYCCGATITRDGYMLLVDNLVKLPKEDEK